ncbi:SusC/RagA family TonB-linked outer membrane protein [Belliella sp. DSM 111904]|uniref:SusC/RagA family TonB-linked outer membrane protein n=1 Tax=Belliella filtrata TaxID=2923435 RepID=A0ABS9V232_9BACT|nr:SusC/RagA family TonB-linked outer membrane protein [Belliella filtrata]MCH7410436.1 SusC/RagA family TonB-linked outer membrane protein [Belliella filtrata]
MKQKFYSRSWILLFLLLVSSTWALGQQSTVTGTVFDETELPLPGVTVMVKGTTNGVVTDLDGKYLINVPEGATLTFSFIGFDVIERVVANQSVLDVHMQSNTSDLEEVVVIGYGTAKKRDITGAVSTVKNDMLKNENPNSVQDILRGNAAGLNVGLNTDAKGGGSLEVRGRTSLNAGNSPLLVVDGAIYYGQLADINPNDIETLEVLKDASAAAVFGAKAASGVILINTKRGKEGRSMININSNIGLGVNSRFPEVYGPEGFISYREEVQKSTFAGGGFGEHQFSDPRNLPSHISMDQWLGYDGSAGDPVAVWLQRLNLQPNEIENYFNGQSVNWYDRVFQAGLRQDHTVSLSGSKDDFKYFWSLGYLNNQGVVIGDEFKTFRSRVNLEGKVNKFLTVGMNTQFANRDESQVPVGWGAIRTLSPWGTEFEEDGSLKWRPNNEQSGGKHPSYDRTYIDRVQREFTINSTLYAALDLPYGFSFRTNFTPRFEFYERYNHESAAHVEWAERGGNASRQQRKVYNWQIDNILTWQKQFAEKHDFNVTLLANAEQFQSWDNTMSNNGFEPHDRLGFSKIDAGINPLISSHDQYSTGDALMGRLIYSYDGKYSTTMSIRRDGYSAFGQLNPRATFYSAAVGWLFSDENFINLDWLDYGKLRLSWGSNGNRDIGRYDALSDLATGKYFYQRPNGELYFVNQLYVNRMENPRLRWERTQAINIGLDFSILQNKLDGTIEAYTMSTTDLLVQRSLPDILGFSWVYDNLGEVQNRGLELSLTSRNISRNNFSWTSIGNFQMNRNVIKSLYGDLDENGNELDDFANQWFIGQAIDRIWHYKTDGIWQVHEAAEAAEYGVRPGDYKVIDVDGDGQFTNADRQFQGYTQPRFRISLRNDFRIYKNFEIGVMMYSYLGHMGSFNQMKNRDGFLDRTNAYITPYWTEENPSNEWARLNSSEGGASGFNVYRLRSFVRLENVSLSYTVPKKTLQKFKIENLRLYGNVRNVGVFAPEWGFWDPENSGPVPRLFTMGIDLTL